MQLYIVYHHSFMMPSILSAGVCCDQGSSLVTKDYQEQIHDLKSSNQKYDWSYHHHDTWNRAMLCHTVYYYNNIVQKLNYIQVNTVARLIPILCSNQMPFRVGLASNRFTVSKPSTIFPKQGSPKWISELSSVLM